MKHLNLTHSYQTLPDDFYASVVPEKVPNPRLLIVNQALAEALGLSLEDIEDDKLAQYFSGNEILPSAAPIAQAYAGHQFGYLNLLGDGRAVLLGEHLTPNGSLVDIQLKGSGRTPFSRNGDGRATLAPMLREYLMSEAMFALGIPTTQSLAVVTTGAIVRRQGKQTGAVLVRTAASHLRIGTFVYAAMLGNQNNHWGGLKSLLDYSIKRHYPDLISSQHLALSLLDKVIEQQIYLLNHWLRVGFIHGVLNTDNVTISGETIDYGPCAFMDTYHEDTVYSSIDQTGRYAFGQQVAVTQWNLARFAESLLPLISDDKAVAKSLATERLDAFVPQQREAWQIMMKVKLGIADDGHDDSELIDDLLDIMQVKQLDYTNTFIALTQLVMGEDKGGLPVDEDFNAWKWRWWHRIKENSEATEATIALMQAHNPILIPRNYWVENALSDAENGEMQTFIDLLTAVETPYNWGNMAQFSTYQQPPSRQWQLSYQTFCGT